MTAKELQALERVFAAEINGTLPFQSKAKIFSQLEDGGYVEFVKMLLPPTPGSRPFKVIVQGWVLTHKGRIDYCNTCRDAEEE